jgi:nucleoside-diphosphate-sugar epimerase
VIDICDKLDKVSIKRLEERILKVYPNTYTFTKNLAEQIVSSNTQGLKVRIVRPSIVGPSLQQPSPGWMDKPTVYTGISIDVYNDNFSSFHIPFI